MQSSKSPEGKKPAARIAWGGDRYKFSDGKSTEYYIELQRKKREQELLEKQKSAKQALPTSPSMSSGQNIARQAVFSFPPSFPSGIIKNKVLPQTNYRANPNPNSRPKGNSGKVYRRKQPSIIMPGSKQAMQMKSRRNSRKKQTIIMPGRQRR